MIYKKLGKLVPQMESPVFIEIGAHIGTDTVNLLRILDRHHGDDYRYLAFEPDLRDHARLVGVIGVHPQVDVFAWAIGDGSGTVPFYFSTGRNKRGREHTDSSSLMIPKDNVKLRPWMRFSKGEVYQERLDSLGLDRVDFIWADVQGAEMLMIAGGQKTFRRTHYLYTEYRHGRAQMYHGAPTLQEIQMALPGKWRVIAVKQPNALLENMEWSENLST